MFGRRCCSSFSIRQMTQLAARFCAGKNVVHVVDPVVDLRHRFDDKDGLSQMLKARNIVMDVNELDVKYKRWWNIYEKWINDLVEDDGKKISTSLKKELISESDGLIMALSLPNDISDIVVPQKSMCSPKNSVKTSHVDFLRKMGMIKVDYTTPSIHLVGLPASLQLSLKNFFLDQFSDIAILVATPYMVRGAIIEALNLPKEQFPYFNTGEDFINSFYLVGQCLPSLLSILIKTCLSDKINEWPIRLITSGASYRTFSSHRATDENINLYNAPQQMLVTLLIICNSAIEESLEYDNIINRLQKLFLIKLPLNCHIDNIPPDQLFNFESAASSLRTESNIEVARISRSGTYISNRLNVVYGSNIKTQFVFLVNAEINLTRVVATVFEDYMVDSKPIPSEIQYLLKSHCQL